MKKGIITVTKAKNFVVTLTMENGKNQSPPATQFDETFIKELPQNIPIFYELNSSGSLALVSLDVDKTKVIFPIQSKPHVFPIGQVNKSTQQQMNKPVQTYDPARAPYNFVPLNKEVVISNGTANFSTFEGQSGYIDIRIETKSPLFIRSCDELFANNNGQPYIPGSSFRGMIRNIVNIISYGKLKQFNNKTLFKRSSISDGTNVYPGFLQFKNGIYSIFKATAIQEGNKQSSHWYQFDEQNDSCKFSVGEFNHSCRIWSFKRGNAFIEVLQEAIDGYEDDDTRSEDVIDILKSLKLGKIVNGKITDGKNEQIGNVAIPKNMGIPVFYRIENGKASSFGHAKYHRIPYFHSIGDHIIQDSVNGMDFSESIFGTLDQPSKVYFDDLYLKGDPKFDLSVPQKPKILSSPKPTTFQHYLEQTNTSNKKDWSDQNVPIRGYKNYWHRETTSEINGPNTWIETGVACKSNPNEINPISVSSIFTGRIRFDNLTNEELGALLFSLELPDGCCHKLGMGKPLGLGSILISISRFSLIDRKGRYKSLFNGNSWNMGLMINQSEKDFYKNEYAKYICPKLPGILYDELIGFMCLWKTDRLKKLREILTFDHPIVNSKVNWINRTRYMENGAGDIEVNEFKYRPILPTPDTVVIENTYKKP